MTAVLALTGVSTASELVCNNGATKSLGTDGVWRIFKPIAVQEDLQVARPRHYHKPWKKFSFRVPAETPMVEGFGPPTGGAKDHSTYFEDQDTLPLDAAETRACELFAEATFSVYSREAVDREFAAKIEVQQGMDDMRATLEAITGKLEKVTDELARSQRTTVQLNGRIELLEQKLKAASGVAGGKK